ncbi:PepSY domain-containing protein [Shewanella sp. HL-SH8]|uniref:PepSY domain-containing protein n=1 Tax=Shewanella sp. HL-SH8 TaxID=3436242 RepID=UPI003EB945AE
MTKSRRPNQQLRRQGIKYQILRALRPWHRRLGLFSGLFILLLALTGVAINHSQDFNLDTAKVKQAWLLDYYGINAPQQITVFCLDSITGSASDANVTANAASPSQCKVLVAATDRQLWLKDKLILESQLPIIGATQVGNSLVAVDAKHVYLFSAAGELYETQGPSTGLPQGILALANTDAGVWINTAKGLFLSDVDLLEWSPQPANADFAWLAPMAKNELVPSQWQTIELNARSVHLTWERVMLDLHSGRLFGALTIWLWDLFALALLLVASSGVWIWAKQR